MAAPASQAHVAEENKFDLLVIGGGSGGLACARRAASYGKKVALFEEGRLGGTCVNVGCVPKKVMFNTSAVLEMIHDAKAYCFEGIGEPKFNWGALKAKRDAYVARLNGIYAKNLDNDKVKYIHGHGSFVGARTVRCNGVDYSADHVVVAPGGYPLMDEENIQGALEHCISSDGFFDLPVQPKKVAVVGAGYIAVELAGIFNALGSETHLFVRHDKALRKFDAMVRDTLDEEMRKQGLNVHTHVLISGVDKDVAKQQFEGDLTLRYTQAEKEGKDAPRESKSIEGFDVVLLAIGRGPKTAKLGLELAGVNTRDKKAGGHIVVDEFQNTSAPGVYALGDVCGHVELTPVAIAAGRQLAERLFNGQHGAKLDYSQVPTVVFSHPPIGTAGLTEEEAIVKYGANALTIYTTRFFNMFFFARDQDKKQPTCMKLICAGDEEKVVGVHLIGMAADEMLQGFGVALKAGLTKKQWDSCVAIHPTAGEELVTMRGGKKPVVAHKDGQH